ncbi:MAG: lipopolysaccharide biosynthesis protein [Leptotrichiaceae bacterium]
MEDQKQGFDLVTLIKILYRNILLIAITTILVTSLAFIATTRNKSFKTEINLYSNDRVLREINEIPKFSLSSFDYLSYLHKNSKAFAAKESNVAKFTQTYSQKITVESEDNNPTVKIKFNSTSVDEGNKLAQEYANAANAYIDGREQVFLDSQLKLLQEQYNFINANSDIRTTKDTLTDTLVARLGYYKLLKNDTSPLLKLVNYTTKPAMNKKLVIAFALLMGLFLGMLIAIIKEFSKTLDLKSLKK